jgi:hypothetical protein
MRDSQREEGAKLGGGVGNSGPTLLLRRKRQVCLVKDHDYVWCSLRSCVQRCTVKCSAGCLDLRWNRPSLWYSSTMVSLAETKYHHWPLVNLRFVVNGQRDMCNRFQRMSSTVSHILNALPQHLWQATIGSLFCWYQKCTSPENSTRMEYPSWLCPRLLVDTRDQGHASCSSSDDLVASPLSKRILPIHSIADPQFYHLSSGKTSTSIRSHLTSTSSPCNAEMWSRTNNLFAWSFVRH